MDVRHALQGTALGLLVMVAGCAPVALPTEDTGTGPIDTGRTDRPVGTDTIVIDTGPRPDGVSVDTPGVDVPMGCVDTDMDGISDVIEGRNNTPPTDTDSDGMPDYTDTDSDGDGVMDLDEGVRRYPGFESSAQPSLRCGDTPAHCSPLAANVVNLDSDADGLGDRDEVMYHLDPCNPMTNPGIADLVWAAAGGHAPPPSSLYVVLPYAVSTGGCTAMVEHLHKQFDFSTRFHAADIVFLVDSTGSMSGTITTLSSTLVTRIIPGVVSALGPAGDARYAAGDFKSFPESPNGSPGSDYVLRMGQTLTRNVMAVQSVISRMSASGGADGVEDSTEATWQAIEGDGLPRIMGHDMDFTISQGLMPPNNIGWASRMVPTRDCGVGPDEGVFGHACFAPGRVPIIVLFTDIGWVHDHAGRCNDSGQLCTAISQSYGRAHTFNELATALTTRGAYFVGVDVGSYTSGVYSCQENALEMARRTGTVDGAGMPIAPRGAPTAVADIVIRTVTTLATATRQDVTYRLQPVDSPGIAAGHTSVDFIRQVTPVRGLPGAPAGYHHSDMTTFYGVNPSTIVTFDVDFYNDFQPARDTLQLFQATILVVGRAGTELDRHQVFIVVPQNSCIAPG